MRLLQRHLLRAGFALVGAAIFGCGVADPPGGPLMTKNMPAVAGQQKTCADPHEKTFNLH